MSEGAEKPAKKAPRTIAELRERLSAADWSDPTSRFEVVLDAQRCDYLLKGPLRDEIVATLSTRLGWTTERAARLLALEHVQELRRALRFDVGNGKDSRLGSEDIYPSTGWLGHYLRHVQGSEVPLAWHFWCGLAALAAACRRNVYYDRGNHYLWPCFYLLLIGYAGDGKGSAIGAALDVVKRLNTLLERRNQPFDRRIKILPDRATPERIIELFQTETIVEHDGPLIRQRKTDSVGLVISKELAVLFGRQGFHAGLGITLMTDLWDCPEEWSDSTVGKGNRDLYKVAITFLGATTPEWMRTSVTDEVMAGGFLSRSIFSYRPDSNKVYSTADPLDPIVATWLAEELVWLSTLPLTEFRSDSSWDDWFDVWYARNREETPDEPKMRGYYRRRPTHVVKIAMKLALSEHRLLGTAEDLQMALRCLEAEERYMGDVLGEIISSRFAQLVDYTFSVLWRKGGRMRHSDLFNLVSRRIGNAKEFEQVIETLRQQQKVDLLLEGEGRRRARVYKALRAPRSNEGTLGSLE